MSHSFNKCSRVLEHSPLQSPLEKENKKYLMALPSMFN